MLSGLGLVFQGLVHRVQCSGFRLQGLDLGPRFKSLGFGVQRLGFRGRGS